MARTRRKPTAFDRVSEADWTCQVIEGAQRLGWRVFHARPALTAAGEWRMDVQGDGAGFPYIILARGERMIAAELKSEDGRTMPAQEESLLALHDAGAETYIWRPSDKEEVWKCLE